MNLDAFDVAYQIGSDEILKDIQLSLQGAGTTIIRGKSSSGKTTLSRLLCGVVHPTSGSCTYNGKSLGQANRSDVSVIRRHIGYVEQELSFIEHYSAFDNVILAAGARGLTKSDATAQTLELLADLGLSHVRTQLVSRLSHWERTLVSVARACVGGTTLIVIDQAFDSCDDVSLRPMIQLLEKLCQNQRAIVVTTADDQLDTLFTNPTVYELRDGNLRDISKLPQEVSSEDHGDLI